MLDKFAPLFEPIRIGQALARNRIVSLPHGQNTLPVSELREYLPELARKSAAVVVLGGSVVDPASWRPSLYPLFDPEFTASLADTIEAVRGHGSLFVSQLLHIGAEMRTSEPFQPVWAPSSVPSATLGAVPRTFDIGALRALRRAYVESARNMVLSGADGVELHAAHNYLIHQFLLPSRNKRADEYGGGIDGRGRIVVEILSDLREAFPGKIVGIRLPFGDMSAAGLQVEECAALAHRLSELGLIDYLTVTAPSWPEQYVRDESFPAAHMRRVSRQLKQALSCPVVLSQRIESPELAADVVHDADADMVGLARPLLADPSWGEKIQRGQEQTIRPCVYCLEDCRIHRSRGYFGCSVNPTSMLRPLRDARRSSIGATRVTVVGGGPAGCEAALSAAARGARVVLFERAPALGGRARVAGQAPFRSAWKRYVDYLHDAVQGDPRIEVRLSKPATADAVRDTRPELVVLALGARLTLPDSTPAACIDSDTALLPYPWTGDRVVVYDETGKWDAVNVVERCRLAGKEVVYATPWPAAAMHVPEESRPYLLKRLRQSGVPLNCGVTVDWPAGALAIRHADGSPIDISGPDPVVWCGYAESVPSDALESTGVPTLRIGDCVTPRGISVACSEGALVGERLMPAGQTA